MQLNIKLFALFISWFISTIITVALTPEQVQAKEISGSFSGSNQTSSLLLAQSHEEAMRAFGESGKYTYCDAKILGQYWGESTMEAKVRIGKKILAGPEGMTALDNIMPGAREQAANNLNPQSELCYFGEKGYTYDDAVALARFWGMATPYEAKLKAEKQLIMGRYRAVRKEVDQAKKM
jgi:hypothetical protein